MEIPGVEDLTEIGRGGMAVVYKGRQPTFSREVAVKVVTVAGVDERLRHRFEQELQAVGALSEHPNIITVHGAGETDDGLPYLIMGYQPSGSLGDRLRTRGPVPWAEVADIGVKMAGALESAHRAGVLHRDIKPENILVSSFGEPVLADFGIARLEGGAQLTASGMVTGTPAHTAPEALQGKPASAASDVYGLASTLHQLLTGTPAFVKPTDESTLAVMNRVLSEPPPDLRAAGVPPALAAVVDQGMAKVPAERYATAAEFGQALRGAQQALGVPVTPLPVALEAGAQADSGETVVVAAPIAPLLSTPKDALAPPPPPPPVPVAPIADPEPSGGASKWWLAAVALVLIGVLGFVVLRSDDDGGEQTEDLSPPPSSETTVAPTTTTTTPPTTTSTSPTTTTEFVVDPSAAVPLTFSSVTASSTAADGVDLSGDVVTYAVANTLDGDPETAWRTDGDGVGETITLQIAGGPMYVTAVGLIPGYAKVDPVDGTDRFTENRRVESAEWAFDGAITQGQAFDVDDRNLQSIPVDAVLTSRIVLTIMDTTEAGGRDFTPISEIEIRVFPLGSARVCAVVLLLAVACGGEGDRTGPETTVAAGEDAGAGVSSTVAVPSTTAAPTTTTAVPVPAEHVFPLRPATACDYQDGHHDYPANDIFCPIGTEVVAVTDGVVDFVTRTDEWDPAIDDPALRGGISVAVVGDDGVRYYGSHLSSVDPAIGVGDRVVAGQRLGLSGDTGNAAGTDPHLHFGISRPTTPEDWMVRRGEVNPFPYLQAWERGENLVPAV